MSAKMFRRTGQMCSKFICMLTRKVKFNLLVNVYQGLHCFPLNCVRHNYSMAVIRYPNTLYNYEVFEYWQRALHEKKNTSHATRKHCLWLKLYFITIITYFCSGIYSNNSKCQNQNQIKKIFIQCRLLQALINV